MEGQQVTTSLPYFASSTYALSLSDEHLEKKDKKKKKPNAVMRPISGAIWRTPEDWLIWKGDAIGSDAKDTSVLGWFAQAGV